MEAFATTLDRLQPAKLVAHNMQYDRPVIEAECARLNRTSPFVGRATACTMLAARRRWPRGSARLGDVHQRLFGVAPGDAHDAGADTWACARIFFALRQGITTSA